MHYYMVILRRRQLRNSHFFLTSSWNLSIAVPMGDHAALTDGVDLTSGSIETALRIIFSEAAAEVDGTVRGDDGKPAPGSVVTLIPDPPRPPNRPTSINSGTRIRTGSLNGRASGPGITGSMHRSELRATTNTIRNRCKGWIVRGRKSRLRRTITSSFLNPDFRCSKRGGAEALWPVALQGWSRNPS
jgi:hypothetical protein